jgi:hypothetical protein
MFADIVIMAGGWVLNASAFGMLVDDSTELPRRKTLAYAVALACTAVAFVSKALLLSAVSYSVGALIWFALAVWRSA